MPENKVDHIDHVKTNNKWGNLCNATDSSNSRNRPMNNNNTSGHVGVSWCSVRRKWTASIGVKYKRKNLGSYKHMRDAISARKDAEIKFDYHANNGLLK